MNIVNKRFWFFLVAAILVVFSFISLAIFGLNPGIDFASGSLLTVRFDKPVEQSFLRLTLDALGYQGSTIQPTVSGDYIIHSKITTDAEKKQLEASLTDKVGTFQEESFSAVPKEDASSAIKNAGIAVIISIIGMLLYIIFAFRKMPNPFRYGVCAVAGLAFDLIIALGAYSVFGKLLGWEVNLMFIAGILAILGFSINNTIIVFDRIRENTGRGISHDIEVVTNASIVQTLGRSFNSSLTALFTLFVLALFVGSSIQSFVTVLIIGVISGVFTSTCLAPEMLISWQKKSWGISSGQDNRLVANKAKS
jgi:preprotein translocase subunit SecF